MKSTYAIQDYIKTITSLSLNSNKTIIKLGDIAKRLNISPAAVNDMAKKLVKENLIISHAYKGIELTPQGLLLGKKYIRNHRLWEVFLHEVLQISWDNIHNEAEQLEHAASESLMDKIASYLNHPTCDPHGNPIPAKDGTIILQKNEKKLANCPHHTLLRIVRFSNMDANYLHYLSQIGLTIGSQLSIETILKFDHTFVCNYHKTTINLSQQSANSIYVTPT